MRNLKNKKRIEIILSVLAVVTVLAIVGPVITRGSFRIDPGILDQAEKHPWELSGGQQQRVAIARAIINHPTLLLADEPTGNLDSTSGDEVLKILRDFNQQGQTTLIVTHSAAAAALAKYVLFLRDGLLVDKMPGGDEIAIAQRLLELR